MNKNKHLAITDLTRSGQAITATCSNLQAFAKSQVVTQVATL